MVPETMETSHPKVNKYMEFNLNFTDENKSLEDYIGNTRFKDVLRFMEHDFFQVNISEWETWTLLVIYLISFICSIVANTVSAVIIIRFRNMRRISNCLIMTLTMADFLVTLICMPIALGSYIYKLWVFGEFICKISNYVQGVSVSASVFSMTVMSMDRFFVICQPMRSRRVFCRRHFRWAITGLWVMSLIIFTPVLYVRETQELRFYNRHGMEIMLRYCVERWPNELYRQLYGAAIFCVVFLVPGAIIVYDYSRIGYSLYERNERLNPPNTFRVQGNDSKKLVLKRRIVATRFLILTIVFAVCWMPYNIASLILDFKVDTDTKNRLLYCLPFLLFLGHFNSAANPILYLWLNRRFKWRLMDPAVTLSHDRVSIRDRRSRDVCWSKFLTSCRLARPLTGAKQEPPSAFV